MHKLLIADGRKEITRRTRATRVRRAQHTELKLSGRRKVSEAVCATALRSHFTKLWYIDAFAGTGSRTVRARGPGSRRPARRKAVPDAVEQRRGQLRIAIDVTPQFDHSGVHGREACALRGAPRIGAISTVIERLRHRKRRQ